MAERRMFSKRIINSARFLKMGAGAQNLYFHLCLNADDDGVVEAYPVRRGIGANDDDLQNLIGRGFVLVLDEDNEVVLIADWTEHNKIRADRIQVSFYRELIERKYPEIELVEPKTRSDLKGGRSTDGPRTDNGRSTDGPRTGHGQAMDRLGEVRLSKDKLSKDKEVEESKGEKKGTRKRFSQPTLDEVKSFINENGYHVNAEKWYSHYEANGWMVGKNKMKDWHAAIRYWEHNDFGDSKKQQEIPFIEHTKDEGPESWGEVLG